MIWANVISQDWIIRIDPETGNFDKAVDLTELHKAELKYAAKHEDMEKYDHGNNVLNGIAWDEKNDEYYVTGKRWNFMFRIKLHID